MQYNKNGLNNDEVILNRKKYGTNSIDNINRDTFFKLLIETFGDPIIKILLIALGIKTVFLISSFDWFETIGIVIAIIIASFISSLSEYGSAKAFARLQEESSKIKCRVKRSGYETLIDINDIVYNDIIVLSSGDRIPADGILIDGNLSVDESTMNGESKEIYKDNSAGLYRGTVVNEGYALMIVTKVGTSTLYGQLSKEVSEKGGPSPLKLRLTSLAKIISRIGYGCSILVSISYLFSKIIIENNFNINLIINTLSNLPLLFNYIINALTLCVTIIVVAVPEGLPMMITLVLSSNMRKMLKGNVLVRKLVGIETSGSLNILFTDKTGTLTKGSLEVIGFITSFFEEYNYVNELNKYPKYKELFIDSLLYNNESYYNNSTREIIGGNITDKAILKYIGLEKQMDVEVEDSILFNSKNKYSISLIKKKNKNYKLIKGAPEIILNYCNSYYTKDGKKEILKDKDKVLSYIQNITKKGIRVLALAISEDRVSLNNLRGSSYLGIIMIKDDIRLNAKNGIELIKKAHVKIVMITGDNKDTAKNIATELGLVTNTSDLIFDSYELNNKSDDEIKLLLPKIKVIARALPQDKSRLVKLAQELNLVVGMTGDGVNDAAALKKADVGFSMGSGTEVAKEASDIIILDNNINSIASAILFGRTVFKSIRKFIIFQLTINLCAVSISLIGPFIGITVPITIIQMLWINMIMDTLAGLAFSYEIPQKEYMDEFPKKKEEHIINKYMLNEILITGVYSSILCLFFLKSNFIMKFFRYSKDNKYLMTGFFGLFIFMSLFNAFNARTHRIYLLNKIYKNRVFIVIISFIVIIQIIIIYYGKDLFRTTGLIGKEFFVMILLSFSVIPVDICRKLYLRRKNDYSGV